MRERERERERESKDYCERERDGGSKGYVIFQKLHKNKFNSNIYFIRLFKYLIFILLFF
jgi:hypothetical protein